MIERGTGEERFWNGFTTDRERRTEGKEAMVYPGSDYCSNPESRQSASGRNRNL